MHFDLQQTGKNVGTSDKLESVISRIHKDKTRKTLPTKGGGVGAGLAPSKSVPDLFTPPAKILN